MQITQMINSNGNPAANQFVIDAEHGQYFQSYNTVIAYKPSNGDTVTVSSKWDFSATTLKHLKLFLGTSLSKKQLQDRIDNGSIILTNSLTVK